MEKKTKDKRNAKTICKACGNTVFKHDCFCSKCGEFLGQKEDINGKNSSHSKR